MSRFFKSAAFPILIVVVLAFFAQKLIGSSNHGPRYTFGNLLTQLDQRQVKQLSLDQKSNQANVTANVNGQTVKYTVGYPDNYATTLIDTAQKDVQAQGFDVQSKSTNGWLSLLTYILPFIIFIGFWIFLMNQVQGGGSKVMSFGKSRAKRMSVDSPKITFRDVAGVDEAVEELHEIKEFLENPKKFQALGARIPKVVLRYEPPGTGKTLLARAVAGEAGVPFFSISGSDFVGMFVGVGASRVRDLFEQGKKNAPCIIFIDEIDAVGRHRGAGLGGGHDEREQTLNQLLVEMDGFASNRGVIIMAATNRPETLDAALMRPGRFDRTVVVDRPDIVGREAILKVHARNVRLGPDVDLRRGAGLTPGSVGADLANLVNEAALLGARRNLDRVTQNCFNDALDKILLGAERPLVLSDEDLNVTAYHEGGHALTGLLSEGVDPVTKVTIIPRGQALGVTMYTPLDDRYNYSKEYLLAQIVTALGGRASEQVAIGHITTGAADDLQRVMSFACQTGIRWGMIERLGTISFSERSSPFMGVNDSVAPSDYSETTAEAIDDEVERIVSTCYARAVELLTTHRPTLDRIAQELRRHEVVDASQLKEIMEETGAVIASPQTSSRGTPQVIAPSPPTPPLKPEINSTGTE